MQKRKLTQNPFYKCDSSGSDSDSSIDEGIIAVDSDSEVESVKSFCDKKSALAKAKSPKVPSDRSRSESNKISKPSLTLNKNRNLSKRDFFVADYGSDCSENFDSDCELLSDEEEIESDGLNFNIHNNDKVLSIRYLLQKISIISVELSHMILKSCPGCAWTIKLVKNILPN